MSAYLSHTERLVQALTRLRAAMERGHKRISARECLAYLQRQGINPLQSKQALTDAKRRVGIRSKKIMQPRQHYVWTTSRVDEALRIAEDTIPPRL